MPEGDTVHRAAAMIRAAIGGDEVVDLWGSARALQRFAARLRGSVVTDVFSRGKHHVVVFDDRFVLRTHMGMTGSWRVFAPGERWSKSRGKARVVIETTEAVAVCFAAPDIQAGTLAQVEQALAHLGPDLLAAEFDPAVAVARSHASNAAIAADLLLDQRVMAGVGNEYKSEILFLEELHPAIPVVAIDDRTRRALATRARELLWANKDRAVDHRQLQAGSRALRLRPRPTQLPPLRHRHRFPGTRRSRTDHLLVSPLPAGADVTHLGVLP